jgi:hypothetical protein
MTPTAALNSEIISDLDGKPLDRNAALFLKAIDKLLTVGAYYSADHSQYAAVAKESCAQIVQAIGTGRVMAIEITASGMMVRSQLLDPQHRNIRLLHDLLVPLNIARLEISAGLTPADLRQAIAALQEHKLNLGNTEGFQEIRIENLPPTVSTASRSVSTDTGDREEGAHSLDDLLSGFGAGLDESLTGTAAEDEQLARTFLAIVAQILENLEQAETSRDGKSADSRVAPTSENLQALRVALQRLVEVNPDPQNLVRLIRHAKHALELSRDSRSVDLVFSLLKREVEQFGDWKSHAQEKFEGKARRKPGLSLTALHEALADLDATESEPVDRDLPSSGAYLGICLHLLGAGPSAILETNILANLTEALRSRSLSPADLKLCSTAVAAVAMQDGQAAVDKVLPAFTGPLLAARPEYLGKFWGRLWSVLPPERRTTVWPYLVSDLLQGLGVGQPGVQGKLWLAAGKIHPKAASRLAPRLNDTAAGIKKEIHPSLLCLPLRRLYPVHLALLKSSFAAEYGPRLHQHLRRHPANPLVEILLKASGDFDAGRIRFYLTLAVQNDIQTIDPKQRRHAAKLIVHHLLKLRTSRRKEPWVMTAIELLGSLEPGIGRTQLHRIRDNRRFFFLRAWPKPCRQLAARLIVQLDSAPADQDGSA